MTARPVSAAAKAVGIRAATVADLPGILALEVACFEAARRSARTSLVRSLGSPVQSVWVVDGGEGLLHAVLVMWHRAKSLRVYDIAVHPDARGRGLFRALMDHAETLARDAGAERVSLEAAVAEPALVAKYEHLGYLVKARLPDYYGAGLDAVRMGKTLPSR